MQYELKQTVCHKITSRIGVVYGRAEYVHGEPNYYIFWSGSHEGEWVTQSYLGDVNETNRPIEFS